MTHDLAMQHGCPVCSHAFRPWLDAVYPAHGALFHHRGSVCELSDDFPFKLDVR